MFDRTQWQVNLERRDELLEVAQAHRLIKKPKAERHQVKDSFFANVGDRLVNLGLRLKARSESAAQ
jgi:hypothetical protein